MLMNAKLSMEKLRYKQNTVLTLEEQVSLSEKTAGVIGCGGLGGYHAEMLARLGIGHIKVCDGDVFDETNLNRQLGCKENNIGQNKAEALKQRISEINGEVKVTCFNTYLDEKNAGNILNGCDIVLDGLDRPKAKIMLEELCAEAKIPLIHGAVEGWFGQVTTSYPGDCNVKKLYGENTETAEEIGCPSFTPAVVAGIMTAEAVKALIGKGELLRGRVLFVDLLNGDIDEGKI